MFERETEMPVLEISSNLTETIRDEASARDLTVEEYLRSVVARERTLADRRKVEQEQEWWMNLSLSERARYEGKFVAVHNRRVIDCDADEDVLYRRVRSKYGSSAILIMPAEGPREIRVISPRLA